MNSTKSQKDMTLKGESCRSQGVQHTTWEELRAITNSSRDNEATGPRQKQHSVMGMSGGGNNVQC